MGKWIYDDVDATWNIEDRAFIEKDNGGYYWCIYGLTPYSYHEPQDWYVIEEGHALSLPDAKEVVESKLRGMDAEERKQWEFENALIKESG